MGQISLLIWTASIFRNLHQLPVNRINWSQNRDIIRTDDSYDKVSSCQTKKKNTKTLTFFQWDDTWKLPPTRSNMKNNNCVQLGHIKSEEKDFVLLVNPWKRRLHFLEWDTDWATHLGGSIQSFKMTICYDQGCNDIGVVIATKWRYYLFYLQQYISALGPVLPKSFTRVFSSNTIDVRQV